MNRTMKHLLKPIVFLLTAFAAMSGRAGEGLPNVVFILADDLGWADIGYNNPKVYSPRLDRLAANGLLLKQHYVMPQCTPTRVALLTGRYPGRFGAEALQASNEPAIPLGTFTLANMFKQAGFETHLSGKWHLGSTPQNGPNEFGFDSSYGSFAGAVGMYDHRYRTGPFEQTWHRNQVYIDGSENGVHATDLVTSEAIRVIRQSSDQPYFLYIPFHSVHTPLDERGQFASRPTQLDSLQPHRWLDESDIRWFNDPEGKIQQETDPEKRLLLAAVHHLDDAVGQIEDAIVASGKRDNTIIIFSSDNGPQGNWSGSAYPDDLKLTNFNQPLPYRGKKLDVWEGGIHVPAFVNWPSTIGPGVLDQPVHIVDWLPTLASICKSPLPKELDLDGVDISTAILRGREIEERSLYWTWNRETNRWAVRMGDWKIVKYGIGAPSLAHEWQLFDLATDPEEKNDISQSQPEILETLHAEFLKQRARDQQ